MVFITPEGKVNVLQHKYKGGIFFVNLLVDNSILAHLFMGRFYDFFVTFFPTYIAPNLITASGFAFIVAAFILECMFFYCLPFFSDIFQYWNTSY